MDSSYTLRTISDILHDCQRLIFFMIINKSDYDTIAANNIAIAQRLILLEADIVAIRDPTNIKQNQLVAASEKESAIITTIARIKNALVSSQSAVPRVVICATYNCTSTLKQRNNSNLITLTGINNYVLSTSTGAGSLEFVSSDVSKITVDTDFGSFLLNTAGFSFASFEFSMYFESGDTSILTGPPILFGLCLITNTNMAPIYVPVSQCQPVRTVFNNAPGFTGGGRHIHKIQTASISARIYVANPISAKLFYGCGYVPFFRVRMY